MTPDSRVAVACGETTIAIWSPEVLLRKAAQVALAPELLSSATAELCEYGSAVLHLQPAAAYALVGALHG